MTELRHFLASLYDSTSEAEMQAILNGQRRLQRMIDSKQFPEDVSLPVYHATNLSVSLDVGLEARETKRGIQLFVTEASDDDDTTLDFDLEVYDFLESGELSDLDIDIKDLERSSRPGVDVHIPLREPPLDADDTMDEKRRYYREQERSEEETNDQTDHNKDDRSNDDETTTDETQRDGDDTDSDENDTGSREDGMQGERNRKRSDVFPFDLPKSWPPNRDDPKRERDRR